MEVYLYTQVYDKIEPNIISDPNIGINRPQTFRYKYSHLQLDFNILYYLLHYQNLEQTPDHPTYFWSKNVCSSMHVNSLELLNLGNRETRKQRISDLDLKDGK